MTTTLHCATLHYDCIPSPIGEVLMMYKGEALCVLDFDDYEDRMRKLLARLVAPPPLVTRVRSAGRSTCRCGVLL